MKKFITLTSLCLTLSTFNENADACTSLLVGKNASTDGSTMISYAADSHVLYGDRKSVV